MRHVCYTCICARWVGKCGVGISWALVVRISLSGGRCRLYGRDWEGLGLMEESAVYLGSLE